MTFEVEMEKAWRILEGADEYGDCLIWRGAKNTTGGYPVMKTDSKNELVRRLVFTLNGGTLKPRQPVAMLCGEKCCVNPAHMKSSSTREIAQMAAKRGAFVNPTRGAKIAQKRRASDTAKLTMEVAREIRMSNETGPVLAARYGVNKTVINGIKAGKRWKDYRNPFAQLMAQNDHARRAA